MERPGVNQDLLAKRYAQGDEKTWMDISARVARHAASDNEQAGQFLDLIHSGEFFPSRMTYMGTDHPFASSCFVFPVEDSLDAIMKTLSEACQVQKYGGGTGYNFSRLRPKGDIISTSGGAASGPVSFMGLFHNAMEVVHRAGKKHAAQMGILNCDHPDIMKFIQCKDIEGAYWTFNISVAVTDVFMDAVKNDADWDLKFGGTVYETIKARDLWGYICQHAHHNGDPGVIFIDTVNRNNCYPEPIEACNPCGEQFLPPHVSCNLGSLDLSRFVAHGGINMVALAAATEKATRFLDGSVQNAFWPVPEIEEKTRKYRNIGIGVMGWADALILMGIPYDSERAVSLGRSVMDMINRVADEESRRIGNGTRVNTTVTSIAPTGSISTLAGCSSGIEPLFGVVTTRHSYVGTYHNVHWIFEGIAKERGFYSDALMAEVAERGSVQGLDAVPEDVQRLFKTTTEIDYHWHVRHQAAFQAHTDNAVSKTINLANNATVEDVANAYWLAYETGCKSITVYRDGSRQVQVLENKPTQRDMCPNCNAILFMSDGVKKCVTCGYVPAPNDVADANAAPRRRPDVLRGYTARKQTPMGNAYVTINEDESGQPFEVFLNVGKAGSETAAVSEGIGRIISLFLRSHSRMSQRERLDRIAHELENIGSGSPLGLGKKRVRSLVDGIGQVLTEYLHNDATSLAHDATAPTAELTTGDLCPECGAAEFHQMEGCATCAACGYSKC